MAIKEKYCYNASMKFMSEALAILVEVSQQMCAENHLKQRL